MENKEKIRALFQKWKKERTDENFENFYNASKTLVYKIAFTFLKNEEDSKDLVQEIFVKINGQRLKILGRLGMFHVTVEITGKNVNIDDEVLFEVSPMFVDSKITRKYI